jgi:glycosyltransferase involved in cell wall biosynthesis
MQILEAFSLGTPVLASQVTALPEVSGDAALLVNPYNTKDIAHALQHLLTDSEFRDRLAQKGLERAKEFSWQKSASQILTAFENFK